MNPPPKPLGPEPTSLDPNDPVSDVSGWLTPIWANYLLDQIENGNTEPSVRRAAEAELAARTQLHVSAKESQLRATLAEAADQSAMQLLRATVALWIVTAVLALATVALVVVTVENGH